MRLRVSLRHLINARGYRSKVWVKREANSNWPSRNATSAGARDNEMVRDRVIAPLSRIDEGRPLRDSAGSTRATRSGSHRPDATAIPGG
jgi:hypothetical protein